MHRWTALIIGLLLAASLTLVLLAAPLTGAQHNASSTPPPADKPPAPAAPQPPEPPPVPAEDAEEADAADEAALLASGGPLPADAPQRVTFGVILVTFAGAELAPPNARTRREALALAATLAKEAQTDFAGAVKKGDRGSTKNAGRIPQGVLEPGAQHALFTLSKGEVSQLPIETPRGFWIVKRLR